MENGNQQEDLYESVCEIEDCDRGTIGLALLICIVFDVALAMIVIACVRLFMS